MRGAKWRLQKWPTAEANSHIGLQWVIKDIVRLFIIAID